MSYVKDAFIAAHEEQIEEYLIMYPWRSWDQAYNDCADAAYDRMKDNLADMGDRVRLAKKDKSC